MAAALGKRVQRAENGPCACPQRGGWGVAHQLAVNPRCRQGDRRPRWPRLVPTPPGLPAYFIRRRCSLPRRRPGASMPAAPPPAARRACSSRDRQGACRSPAHRRAQPSAAGRDRHLSRPDGHAALPLELHVRIHVPPCDVAHGPLRVVRVRRHAVDLRVVEQARHRILVPGPDRMPVPVPLEYGAYRALQGEGHDRGRRVDARADTVGAQEAKVRGRVPAVRRDLFGGRAAARPRSGLRRRRCRAAGAVPFRPFTSPLFQRNVSGPRRLWEGGGGEVRGRIRGAGGGLEDRANDLDGVLTTAVAAAIGRLDGRQLGSLHQPDARVGPDHLDRRGRHVPLDGPELDARS